MNFCWLKTKFTATLDSVDRACQMSKIEHTLHTELQKKRKRILLPAHDLSSVTGTTTVGTISWQSGTVAADLTVDVTGYALDFIGLDGTTAVSLIVADATESEGTLTWTVATQPRSPGDKLMLRIRRISR